MRTEVVAKPDNMRHGVCACGRSLGFAIDKAPPVSWGIKLVKTRLLALIAGALPIAAGAWSCDVENDQTHREPGGVYGIFQQGMVSTTYPDRFTSFVCSGEAAVVVSAIRDWIKSPTNSGLRELWGLSNYRTNSLPDLWLPDNPPSRVLDISAFQKFSWSRDGTSIRQFIGRFGLPSRYLTGQWSPGQVWRWGRYGPVPDETGTLQGLDFLIYDLPSGHAVALCVSKPPWTRFVTATIIDSKGDLLIPNMVELQLPLPPEVVPPRKLTAEPDGKLTAPTTEGGKETIGTWIARDRQLVITTIKKNTEAVLSGDSIWLGKVEYVRDIIVNDHEIICCGPVAGKNAADNSGR